MSFVGILRGDEALLGWVYFVEVDRRPEGGAQRFRERANRHATVHEALEVGPQRLQVTQVARARVDAREKLRRKF